MGKHTGKDTADYSGDSSGRIREANHDARDHARESGFLKNGDKETNSKPFPRDDDSGKAAGGFWKSIFG
ncbi:MAG: hypothetical protein WAX38_01995 [Minisyncoccia bacterium]